MVEQIVEEAKKLRKYGGARWRPVMEKGKLVDGRMAQDSKYKLKKIDVKNIQTAVTLSLPSELSRYAISEGTKAVKKYRVDRRISPSVRAAFSSHLTDEAKVFLYAVKRVI